MYRMYFYTTCSLLLDITYISVCELKNSIPKLQVYLQLLLTSMKIEKKIALENNTLNSFERKWNPLKDASSTKIINNDTKIKFQEGDMKCC